MALITTRPAPPERSAAGGVGVIWRIAGALVISLAGWLGAVGNEREIGWWFVTLDLTLGAAAFAVMHWRTRWPVGLAYALAIAATVSISSSGPGLLVLASLARQRRVAHFGPVAVLTLASWMTFELITDTSMALWQVGALSVIAVLGAVGLGLLLGPRRPVSQHGRVSR